jgi:DNA-directed RNA polymerase beta subunit/intein/homing endonuclease
MPTGLPDHLRDPLDFKTTNSLIQQSIVSSFNQMEPREYGKYRLEVSNPTFPNKMHYSKKEQKEHILKRKDLDIPVKGVISLYDKETNQLVDQRKTTLVRVPYLTERGTYIKNGGEYTLAMQKRLRPGAYTRKTATGDFETFIKTKAGSGFNIGLEPKTGRFMFKIYNSKTPLYSVMRGLGVSDEELKQLWGKELYQRNFLPDYNQHLKKVWTKINRGQQVEVEDLRTALIQKFGEMELDEETTSKTMGAPHKNVTPELLKEITKTLLAVRKGERDTDNKDSYSFQKVYGPEDFFSSGLKADKKGLLRTILHKAQSTGNLDHVHANLFKPVIDHVFYNTRLGQCFDEETKVLTDKGFKYWRDVTYTDKLACDVEGKLEFHEANELFEYEYDGELIGCQTKRLDYLVTPNHRLWLKSKQNATFKEVKAEDAFGKQQYHATALPPRHEVVDPENFSFTWAADRWGNEKTLEINYLDWMEFLGWWVAEGSAWDKKYPKQHDYRVTIAQSEANPEGCRKIETLLNRMPFKWRRGSNKTDYVIAHKGLSLLLQSYGTKKDKSVPDYVRHSSNEALRRFFDAFMLGDGNEYNGYLKSQVVSEKLTEDLVEIWSKLTGGTAQISVQDRTHEGWGVYYTVSFSKNAERMVPTAKSSEATGWSNPHYKQPYRGKVYCASVPGEKLFVMRLGKCLWTLNSLEEINPMDAIDANLKLTAMGEEGFSSNQGVPDEARQVQDTQFGYVDPIRSPECHDLEFTEVMTEGGWKAAKDITLEDKLATVVDGSIVFNHPVKIFNQEYTGPMYGTESRFLGMKVTPNHRLWSRPSTHKAKEYYPEYRFEDAESVLSKKVQRNFMTGGFEAYTGDESYTTKNIAGYDIAIEDWCDLMGWYLSEGCANKTYREVGSWHYRTRISQTKSKGVADIKELLKRLPFAWNYCEKSGDFTISSKDLCEYMLQFGKSYDKYIPEDLFHAPAYARERLLSSLMAGDGKHNGSDYYCTVSPQLRDDVVRLAFGLGYAVSYKKYEDTREDRYLDLYEICLHKLTERVSAGKYNFIEDNFSGRVWCATVPGGLMYVRYKRPDGGLGHWSGNSGSVGVDGRLAYNTFKGIDGKLYSKFKNLNGGTEFIANSDIDDSVITFPGEMEKVKKGLTKKVRAMDHGKLTYVDPHEVQYVLPSGEEMFSINANLIPYLSGVKGMRGLMGSKYSITGDTEVLIERATGAMYYGPVEDYCWEEGDRSVSIDKVSKQVVWKPVLARTRHKHQLKIYEVTMSSGRIVKATQDHSFVTLDPSGELVKVHTQNLVPGNKVTAIPRIGKIQLPSTKSILKTPWGVQELDREFGELVGLLNLKGVQKGGEVRLAVSDDKKAEVQAYLEKAGITQSKLSKFYRHEFASGYAPGFVFSAPEEFRKGFVFGQLKLAETRSHNNEVHSIRVGCTDKKRVNSFVVVATSLGLDCNLVAPTKDQLRYRANFHLSQFLDMDTDIPAIEQYKKPRNGRCPLDWLPLYEDFRRTTRGKISPMVRYHNRTTRGEGLEHGEGNAKKWGESHVKWDFVRKIREVNPVQYEYVYDLHMDDNVFMCGTGVVVHNTNQAVSLTQREAPLVRTKRPEGGTFQGLAARMSGAVHSKQGGIVEKVTPDEIIVRGMDGTKEVYDLYNDYPLNRKSFYSNIPMVREGDVVENDQLLADSNYTQDGNLALGKNLSIAYLPYKGYSVSSDSMVYWVDDKGVSYYTRIDEVPEFDAWSNALDLETGRPIQSQIHRVWGHYTDDNMVEVIGVDGTYVKATENHSFISPDENGKLIKTAPKDFVVGKSLIPVVQPILSQHGITELNLTSKTHGRSVSIPVDEDLGWVLGLYVAEGCTSGTNHKSIRFAVTEEELKAKLKTILESWGLKTACHGRTLSTTCQVLGEYLHNECGYLANGKKVPSVVFGAEESVINAFIDGYWCGDGTVTKELTASTRSTDLAKGLCFLLGSQGIRATYREYQQYDWPDTEKRIKVFQYTYDKFPELSLTRKNDRLEALKAKKRSWSKDRIPVPKHLVKEFKKVTGKDINWKTMTVSRDKMKPFLSELPQELVDIYDAPVWWDVVKEVNKIDFEDWVYDLDMRPYGTFVIDCGATVFNTYEDGYVISESAAKKLSSEHMYTEKLDLDKTTNTDRNHFLGIFPGTYTKKQLDGIGRDGVVKPGTVVQKGDPIILNAAKRQHKGIGMLGGGKAQWKNATVEWDHDHEGVITDVWTERDGIKVSAKSINPMEVADKVSGLFGNKGVISKIVPDEEMPRNADGEVIDVIANPFGIVSRHNPSQIVEALLGKIAKKRGKPFELPAFTEENMIELVQKELEKAGMSDTETLLDQRTGKEIPNVMTGIGYFLKLHHMAAAKASGVGETAYTMSGAPTAGLEGDNPKRVGLLEMDALIAHGVPNVIKDVKLIRGQENQQYWRDLMDGKTPPMPGMPMMYKRLMATLRSAGINVKSADNGTTLQLAAMTDDDITKLSTGELGNSETVKWKTSYDRNLRGEEDLNPVAGGLFDRGITGGMGGTRFSHINLSEKMPNPAFEKQIRTLLDLTEKGLHGVLSSKSELKGFGTGPKALETALSRIDVDKELEQAKTLYKAATTASARNRLAKRIRALSGLSTMGLKANDLMVSKALVIPPIFRPISINPQFEIIADANLLYKDLYDANKNYSTLRGKVDESMSGEALLDTYKSFKAVVGLGDSIKKERKDKRVKGLLADVFGPSGNKTSIIQKNLIGTPTSYSARGVIVPDPTLDMDHIGIPEDKAWELFAPFVLRRLVRSTDGSPQAKKAMLRHVTEKSKTAEAALEKEMQERPIIYSRAPVLHKYGLIAGYANKVPGHAIRVNPEVEPGLGADHDGDTFNYHVLVSDDAIREAKSKMLPSQNLRATSDFGLLYAPTQDFRMGLHLSSDAKGGKLIPKVFKSRSEVVGAYERGEINLNDTIIVQDEDESK